MRARVRPRAREHGASGRGRESEDAPGRHPGPCWRGRRPWPWRLHGRKRRREPKWAQAGGTKGTERREAHRRQPRRRCRRGRRTVGPGSQRRPRRSCSQSQRPWCSVEGRGGDDGESERRFASASQTPPTAAETRPSRLYLRGVQPVQSVYDFLERLSSRLGARKSRDDDTARSRGSASLAHPFCTDHADACQSRACRRFISSSHCHQPQPRTQAQAAADMQSSPARPHHRVLSGAAALANCLTAGGEHQSLQRTRSERAHPQKLCSRVHEVADPPPPPQHPSSSPCSRPSSSRPSR